MALNETKVASYWPRIVYQGMSGEIREAHYECHRENECWHERVLSTTTAMNSTQLVAAPMGNNLSSLGLFYQEEDGKYINYKEDSDGYSELWTNGKFSWQEWSRKNHAHTDQVPFHTTFRQHRPLRPSRRRALKTPATRA